MQIRLVNDGSAQDGYPIGVVLRLETTEPNSSILPKIALDMDFVNRRCIVCFHALNIQNGIRKSNPLWWDSDKENRLTLWC